MSLTVSSGWCAPAESLWMLDALRPESWPAGLLQEDLEWLAQMLVGTEVLDDEAGLLDLPAISVRRGGLRF